VTTEAAASLRHLYVPADRIFEVQILLSLSTDQLRQVTKALRSTESLENLDEAEPISRIAAASKVSFAQALSVWHAVSNLSRQRLAQKIADGDFLDDLGRLEPPRAPSTSDDERRRALLDLCNSTREGYLLEKAQFLRTAYVQALVSCRSVCEIRPLFDEAHQKIEGAALMVTLGLETRSEEGDTETFVIQASRSKLAELKKCIADAEQKLDVMQRQFGEKLKFF
jgi:hypothetical protein